MDQNGIFPEKLQNVGKNFEGGKYEVRLWSCEGLNFDFLHIPKAKCNQ
jgi:hypothetical protein